MPAEDRSVLPFELRLALRYLSPRRREGLVASVTVVCGLGVLVGVAALTLALAFMSGFQGYLRDRLLASNPHVVVRPGWGDPPLDPGAVVAVAEVVGRHGEVRAWAPFSEEQGLLRSRLVPGGRPAMVKGVDPERESAVTGLGDGASPGAWSRLDGGGPLGGIGSASADASSREDDGGGAGEDDEVLAPLSPEELGPPEPPVVILGHELALELGVVVGDVVHLVTARPELSLIGAVPRSRALRVGGLLTTGVSEYDRGLAVVGLASRQDAAGRPRVDGIQLAVADPLRSSEVAGDLAATLDPNLVVTDWTTTFSRLFAAFRWERLITIGALGLIGLVAGFNIFTILTMNVLARIGDIGVLSAMGAAPANVMRVFTWMGLGIGGVGTALGLALGAVAATLLDHLRLIQLDASVYLISHVPFDVRPADVALVGLGMLAVSFLSTLVPARTAARVDPVVALRAE